VRSLAWKVVCEGANKDEKEMERMCIKTLSKVASKDFEYILKLILCRQEEYKSEPFVKHLEEGLTETEKEMRDCQRAILIAVDQNIDESQSKTDKMLTLELSKSEEDLIK
jgi:hypothetical protein